MYKLVCLFIFNVNEIVLSNYKPKLNLQYGLIFLVPNTDVKSASLILSTRYLHYYGNDAYKLQKTFQIKYNIISLSNKSRI